MRYSHEPTASPLNLESPTQPLALYSSGQPQVFNQPTAYQSEGTGAFYPQSSSHIFPSLDVRPRVGATNTSNPSSGMAHGHRAQLPHPGTQLSSREIYSTVTPSFRRAGEHQPRSPSFPGSIRRHPLSPTPSPSQTYSTNFKMDSGAFGPKALQTLPPLLETTTFGTLHYAEGSGAGSPVKLEINGTIDKGFFLADSEWTCYRRNYFSCICSFSLTPHYSAAMTYVPNGSSRSHNVAGFAMSISAVVSDNDNHVIELVQHTPKRDKGPTARPEKTRLVPKPAQTAHQSMMYNADSGMSVANRYDHNTYGPPQTVFPTEYTFERIQFKQATANNGKRRAAQQYYHLLVELWVDVGTPGNDQFIKIAHRKSAKMIVRGRSPGHYQSERRGSASSGPGGSGGSVGYGSQMMSDFGSAGSGMLPGAYSNAYDPRSSGHYGGGTRHHQHGGTHQQHDTEMVHGIMSTDEVKAIIEPKAYQYYPTPICDSSHDPRQPVEMFSHSSHHRSEGDHSHTHVGAGAADLLAKAKQETHSHDSQMFYPGSSFFSNRCGRNEGKPSSSGYYPTMAPPPTSISMS